MAIAIIALVVSVLVGLVALDGAINARRALDWQKRRDIESRAAVVRVFFEHGAEPHEGYGSFEETPAPVHMTYRLSVIVVNASEQATVFVRSVSLFQLNSETGSTSDGEGLSDASEERDVPLRPLERVVFKVDVRDLTFDVVPGFIGRVELASGETFDSEPEQPWDLFATDPAWLADRQTWEQNPPTN